MIIGLLFASISFSQQITNQEIVAKIKTEQLDDLIKVKATAISKTPIVKSLRYTMYVIRTDFQTSNVSRSQQEGRFILQPSENKELSTSVVNSNTKDKVSVILLVYDDKDKLVGKDNLVVLNDDKSSDIERKKNLLKQASKSNDGIRIEGIVTEDIKTKPARDFFIEFLSVYRLNDAINKKKNIHIVERLSLGRNTNIQVLIDNTPVHGFLVRPNQDFIKQMVQQAIINVTRYIQQAESRETLITQY